MAGGMEVVGYAAPTRADFRFGSADTRASASQPANPLPPREPLLLKAPLGFSFQCCLIEYPTSGKSVQPP